MTAPADKQLKVHLDAVIIVVEDFNHTDLKLCIRKFYTDVNFPT